MHTNAYMGGRGGGGDDILTNVLCKQYPMYI